MSIEYFKELQDSIYTLTYISRLTSDNDTVKIKLKESENFQPEYIHNGEKSKKEDFVFVSSREYKIEGQLFNVYKYAKNPFVIDGCITQFWTPEFGIIIKRSSTWRNFSKLRTSSKVNNQKIDLLFELINQDTEFYKGCYEELELIPKSDAQEFYEWKFKKIDKQFKEINGM